MNKICAIFFLGILFTCSLFKTSEADEVNYTFIKATCDLKAKTATVWDIYGEDMLAKYKAHEKNLYYIKDLSPTGMPPSYKRAIKFCNFGNGQMVAFSAQDDRIRPASSILALYFDKKPLRQYFHLAGEMWKVDIKLIGKNKYKIHQCGNEMDGQFECDEGIIENGEVKDWSPVDASVHLGRKRQRAHANCCKR